MRGTTQKGLLAKNLLSYSMRPILREEIPLAGHYQDTGLVEKQMKPAPWDQSDGVGQGIEG